MRSPHAERGLPTDIPFVGPSLSENRPVGLGAFYQSRTDWHRQRPEGT